MDAIEQERPEPRRSPVGHEGARVDIVERPSRAVSGWLGVLALLVCVGAAIAVAYTPDEGWIAAPIVAFVIVAQSLAVVAPGQTRVVQFFGRYAGTVRRPGFWWVVPLTRQGRRQRAGAKLRDEPPQGQ